MSDVERWHLCCPSCGEPSDEIYVDTEEEPGADQKGRGAVFCGSCGMRRPAAEWVWRTA